MAWVSTSNATASVTFKDIGYSTPDGTLAEVDFQVTKDPGSRRQMRRQGPGFQVRGRRLEGGGHRPPTLPRRARTAGSTTVQRATVRTESPAVSGVVDSCWIADDGK